jgi:hypothetical protein
MDLVPARVGKDAGDDSRRKNGKSSGNQKTESQSAYQEKKGERSNRPAFPTSRGNRSIIAILGIVGRIIPIIEEAASQIETGKGQGDQSE